MKERALFDIRLNTVLLIFPLKVIFRLHVLSKKGDRPQDNKINLNHIANGSEF